MKENFLTFFSVAFIVGLSWHVSMNYNLVVFFPLFFLLFFIQNPFPLDRGYLLILLSFASLFLFWSILNITIYHDYDFESTSLFIRKAFFGLFLMTFIFIFYGKRRDFLAKSIDYALMVIVGLWLMQFFVYYSTGEYIDLLEPILGEVRAQRYQAYFIQSPLPLDLIRPTSIYIEPGTYAVNVFPLLALSYLYHDRITTLHKVILFTYFTSLSLFAFIIGALFLVAIALSKFKFELSKKNIVLFIVLATVLSGIVFYAQYRFVDQGGTEQIGYREMVVSYWLALNSVDTLLGLGAGQTVFDGSTASVLIEDASFMFKLMFEFGIFALPYLFLMLYISRGFAVVFFLIILLTKIHYQIYILWFYPAALYILWQSQEAKKARLEKKFRER